MAHRRERLCYWRAASSMGVLAGVVVCEGISTQANFGLWHARLTANVWVVGWRWLTGLGMAQPGTN
jgi:hypothetical protein